MSTVHPGSEGYRKYLKSTKSENETQNKLRTSRISIVVVVEGQVMRRQVLQECPYWDTQLGDTPKSARPTS